MTYNILKNLISSNLFVQFRLASIMKAEGSLIFYHAGIETGFFNLLADNPLGFDDIVNELNISNRQLLSSFLDIGCSLKEIACKNGRYRLKGPVAKALVNNIPCREIIRETVNYHGDIACRLDSFLLDNTKGDYLEDFGGVIAESSRIMEPMIKGFIYRTLNKKIPHTILELGCGAGEYLRYYVDINKYNQGIAVDIDASAVEIAQRKIRENNIEDNFSAEQDDFIKPQILKNRSFDLVTSFSNMHYLSDEDRGRVFGNVYKLLNEKGRFILATGFKSNNLASSYYDLIFSSTHGLYPLPYINDIVESLKRNGFARIRAENLLGRSFMGIVAYK